jgi:voltage-gated potassium channel Kch
MNGQARRLRDRGYDVVFGSLDEQPGMLAGVEAAQALITNADDHADATFIMMARERGYRSDPGAGRGTPAPSADGKDRGDRGVHPFARAGCGPGGPRQRAHQPEGGRAATARRKNRHRRLPRAGQQPAGHAAARRPAHARALRRDGDRAMERRPFRPGRRPRYPHRGGCDPGRRRRTTPIWPGSNAWPPLCAGTARSSWRATGRSAARWWRCCATPVKQRSSSTSAPTLRSMWSATSSNTPPWKLRQVRKASAVVLALSNDSAGVFATAVVRDYAPEVRLIARVNLAPNVARLYQAGADFALSVGQVAGQILAHHLLGEDAVSVEQRLKLARVAPGSPGRGAPVAGGNPREDGDRGGGGGTWHRRAGGVRPGISGARGRRPVRLRHNRQPGQIHARISSHAGRATRGADDIAGRPNAFSPTNGRAEFFLVAKRGIEPRTRGFSVRCSTN